jgi:hypothetical protein
MTAMPLKVTRHSATLSTPKTAPRLFADNEFLHGAKCVTAQPELGAARSSSRSCALDLSKSRANDAVLEILRAYKLTGNFHLNLEIVLKNIGVFDKVTYRIEPNPKLSYSTDCRYVVFEPNENVSSDLFGQIIESIKARIGFDMPWWAKLFVGSSQCNETWTNVSRFHLCVIKRLIQRHRFQG